MLGAARRDQCDCNGEKPKAHLGVIINAISESLTLA